MSKTGATILSDFICGCNKWLCRDSVLQAEGDDDNRLQSEEVHESKAVILIHFRCTLYQNKLLHFERYDCKIPRHFMTFVADVGNPAVYNFFLWHKLSRSPDLSYTQLTSPSNSTTLFLYVTLSIQTPAGRTINALDIFY